MPDLRRTARSALYRHPWLAGLAWFISGCGFLTAIYSSGRIAWVLASAAIFAGIGYLAGYATRALRNVRHPALDHLHRRRYNEVWDKLTATSREASAAACGLHGEADIQKSGEVPANNIRELAGINKADDVLEIGCGVGRIGLALAPLCRSWTGADISANMLAEARTRLRGFANVGWAKLEKTDLEMFAPETFDLVYSTNMFDHLDQIDRWLYIREALRVLKPGGRLYTDNVDIESDSGWKAFAESAKLLADFERPAFQPHPATGAELSTYARRAGFIHVNTHSRGSLVILTAQKPASINRKLATVR